ncbi:MAG: acetyl-CoA carboxylase biotin carboxyl carrier protein subunit [Phenylobacterium sp.]|uniref:acetyl-CoA carboxylase biotin carboxyl carrier protein subunit n=1 Tax=Phenylobacterium sp. TaxID=1871053 RepID=UPI00391898AA
MKIVVRSDMAATVLRIEAAPGAEVGEDDALVVLEAMKMELPVLAGAAGRVAAIHVEEGQVVEEDQPLVTLEAQR